jgi:CRP-like cAMP-binding protein
MDLDLSDLETVEDLQSRPREERTLPEIPLFSDLEPDAFVAVLEDMRVVRMKPGDWVIREGEEGSSMFVIASGAARVLKKLKGTRMLQLAVLGEGAFFGEMSVLRGGPRGASVQSVQPGELFEISKQVIDKIIGQYPSVEQVLTKFIRQRLLRNVISTSELFRPFNKEERLRIIERFVSRDIGRGELLIEEGRESNGFYILMRGRLDVLCKLDDGFTTVVGELLEGEVFGEISCLRKEPAMATVRASTPASILRLPRTDFDALILGNPQILELVNSLGEQRRAITVNALAKKGILI